MPLTFPGRLPSVGGDNNNWGTVLNNYLGMSLTPTGYLSTITVQTATGGYTSYSPAANPGETTLVNASSNNFTVTLPSATSGGYANQNFYTVKKTDSSANTVTINTTSSQTIDGGLTAVIKVQYASVTVVSDGSNWSII